MQQAVAFSDAFVRREQTCHAENKRSRFRIQQAVTLRPQSTNLSNRNKSPALRSTRSKMAMLEIAQQMRRLLRPVGDTAVDMFPHG